MLQYSGDTRWEYVASDGMLQNQNCVFLLGVSIWYLNWLLILRLLLLESLWLNSCMDMTSKLKPKRSLCIFRCMQENMSAVCFQLAWKRLCQQCFCQARCAECLQANMSSVCFQIPWKIVCQHHLFLTCADLVWAIRVRWRLGAVNAFYANGRTLHMEPVNCFIVAGCLAVDWAWRRHGCWGVCFITWLQKGVLQKGCSEHRKSRWESIVFQTVHCVPLFPIKKWWTLLFACNVGRKV